ncbi:MAG: formylglycine-generating enzyme family protein [Anaerolineaceae bacterium]|nr:formylglycine-generating enzyme family protein [Anaerolineaceae bacterium]
MKIAKPASLCLLLIILSLLLGSCNKIAEIVPTNVMVIDPTATETVELPQATEEAPVEDSEEQAAATLAPTPTQILEEVVQHENAPPPCTDLGQTWISPEDNMVMACIPPTTFQMGASDNTVETGKPLCDVCAEEGFFSADQPQHTVELSAYWIDVTEVTNDMFSSFIDETNYQPERILKDNGSYLMTNGEFILNEDASWENPDGIATSIDALFNHPVVHVTRMDALAYCEWAGRTLPTEAQWEYAALGSSTANYPWGNVPVNETLANIIGETDSYDRTSPVSSFPAGISPMLEFDMTGNAAEWMFDIFDPNYYSGEDTLDPTGPINASNVGITRGGSWAEGPEAALSWHRQATPMWFSSDTIGFRCALPERLLSESFAAYDPCEQVIPAYDGMEIVETETGQTAILVPQGVYFNYSQTEDGGLNVNLNNSLLPFLSTDMTLGVGGQILPQSDGGFMIVLPPKSTVAYNETTSSYTVMLADGICSTNSYVTDPLIIETLSHMDDLPVILTLNSLFDINIDESDGSINFNFDYDADLDPGAFEEALKSVGRILEVQTEALRAGRTTFYLSLPPGTQIEILDKELGIVRIIFP